ncbi:uncharacterized protein M421DRAFT_426642 [Didymella exigua CBS 183.55]|uniref:Uncharacterized protein n=1 Tax=Didymella exigua CBS 183.55 TaxID=1150837 RepID=A0A6A5R5M6_9PLEO|nr:uncharacterized protein M421DRAFT_426642 [Didymella exigua CBS 183.55]KAF1922709.1 hypothetical protein M421DRAFT_426642 [Didymella exigua CBS 183.55]
MICDSIFEGLGCFVVRDVSDKAFDFGTSTGQFCMPNSLSSRWFQRCCVSAAPRIRLRCVRAQCAIIAWGCAIPAPVVPGSLCDKSEMFVSSIVSRFVLLPFVSELYPWAPSVPDLCTLLHRNSVRAMLPNQRARDHPYGHMSATPPGAFRLTPAQIQD